MLDLELPITDLYRELHSLGPTIKALPGLVNASEFDSALAVVGGNERLAAVRALLLKLLASVKGRPDVPRPLQLRLAVLANSINGLDLRASSTFHFILNDLEARGVACELIAPGGDDLPYMQFQKLYPGAGWRFVDWEKVPGGKQFYVREPVEMREHFRQCCGLLNVQDGPVFITTGIVEANMRMTVADLLEHSDVLFTYCSDMLFIGEDAAWIFEVFHEGEIGYGSMVG